VSGGIHVREARPGERDRIVGLTMAAYREYAETMEPAAWAALEGALRGSLADDEGVTRLVAELDGEVAGSAALYDPGVDAYGSLASRAAWPEVRLVAVASSARRHGIARALVGECIRRARHAGATQLGLHTSRSMSAARRLYEAMGFVRDPARDFRPPGAELVEGYRLDLSDHQPTTEH
jgi:GNAT superfamily N-acetyltransferase